MRKTLKGLFFLNILVLFLLAQDKSGPAIKVENPQHKFNLVQQNTVLEHHFKIQNVGSDTLKILKVRPG